MHHVFDHMIGRQEGIVDVEILDFVQDKEKVFSCFAHDPILKFRNQRNKTDGVQLGISTQQHRRFIDAPILGHHAAGLQTIDGFLHQLKCTLSA